MKQLQRIKYARLCAKVKIYNYRKSLGSVQDRVCATYGSNGLMLCACSRLFHWNSNLWAEAQEQAGPSPVCLFVVSLVNLDKNASNRENVATGRRRRQGDDNERKHAKRLTWRICGSWSPFKGLHSWGGFGCIFRNGDGLIQTRQFIMDENIWM